MDVFDGDRPAPDNYDLLILNFYVLLDAVRQRNVTLRRRILAHWKTFQRGRTPPARPAPSAGPQP